MGNISSMSEPIPFALQMSLIKVADKLPFSRYAIPAVAGLGATGVYDQLAFPKDPNPFSDYRRGLNTVFNLGMTTGGAALLHGGIGKGPAGAGAVAAGLGMMVTPPIKDLALMAQKPVHDVSKTMDNVNRNSQIGLGLGAAAVGLGGLGLAKYISSKAKQDSPRVKITLPTKNPHDRETVVDMPLNNDAIPPRTLLRMEQQMRRQLRAETRERALKRDPNTGKLIPIDEWNRMYGQQSMKAASFEDMMFAMEKKAGLAGAAKTMASLTPGVSPSALPDVGESQSGAGAVKGPMSIQGNPEDQAAAALAEEEQLGKVDELTGQLADGVSAQQNLEAELNQAKLDNSHKDQLHQQQLEQHKTQAQQEAAQVKAEAAAQVQDHQRAVAEAEHSAEIEKQKASLQVEMHKAQNNIAAAAASAQNPTGVSPALSNQLKGAVSSISKLAAYGIMWKSAAPVPPPTTTGAAGTQPPAPTAPQPNPAAGGVPAAQRQAKPAPVAPPAAPAAPPAAPTPAQGVASPPPAPPVAPAPPNPAATNTIRPGYSAATLAAEQTVPPELAKTITQEQWAAMDHKTRVNSVFNSQGQARNTSLQQQRAALQEELKGLSNAGGYSTAVKQIWENPDDPNAQGDFFGKSDNDDNSWIGNKLRGWGNEHLSNVGRSAIQAYAKNEAADNYNAQLQKSIGLNDNNVGWFNEGYNNTIGSMFNPFGNSGQIKKDQIARNVLNDKVKAYHAARAAAGTDFNTTTNALRGWGSSGARVLEDASYLYGGAALKAPGWGAKALGMGKALLPGVAAAGAGWALDPNVSHSMPNENAGNAEAMKSKYYYGPGAKAIPSAVNPQNTLPMPSAIPSSMQISGGPVAQPGWSPNGGGGAPTAQPFAPGFGPGSNSPWDQVRSRIEKQGGVTHRTGYMTSKAGQSMSHLTNVRGRTIMLKQAVGATLGMNGKPQYGPEPQGPPRPGPYSQKYAPGAMDRMPGPSQIPMRAAQINGYTHQEAFRDVVSKANEFGGPVKNFLFNTAMPLANVGMQMFGLPSLMPTAKHPATGVEIPPSNMPAQQTLAGMGVRTQF